MDKLICAIDTCMNRIDKNKQVFFYGKKMSLQLKRVNTHDCLISTPIIDSLRMLNVFIYSDNSTEISHMLN